MMFLEMELRSCTRILVESTTILICLYVKLLNSLDIWVLLKMWMEHHFVCSKSYRVCWSSGVVLYEYPEGLLGTTSWESLLLHHAMLDSYFLRKAMAAFLTEQKIIKLLNHLESTCLKKLQYPLVLSNLQLEGLLFDEVYADLMIEIN